MVSSLLFIQDAFLFLHDLYNSYSVLKAFVIFFVDRTNCCFFVFYPIRRINMYYPPRLKFIYDIYNIINEHNQR